MKNIKLSLLFFLVILGSCRNDDSITIDEIAPPPLPQSSAMVEVEGVVSEEFSELNYNLSSQPVANVSVRLIVDGVTLDEVNTDGKGRFIFPKQSVPLDKAYIILEAPEFHKNVSKINNLADPAWNFLSFTLMRKTFPGLTGDDITDEGPYISLKSGPTDSYLSPIVIYITNTDNELIGVNRLFVEASSFEITTRANESLILHYLTECSDSSIEIGSFSEDTDISDLILGIVEDDWDYELLRTKVYDCSDMELAPNWYNLAFKIDGLTRWFNSGSNTFFGSPSCLFENTSSVLASAVRINPRSYGEITYNHSVGQNDIPDIIVCEEDDTFIKYGIDGGNDIVIDKFTYANIISDDNLVVKLRGASTLNGEDISFQIFKSDEGSNTLGDVVFTNGSREVFIVGVGLNFTIDLNDGKFIEGTFSGEVSDAFETSQGIMEGSFRARIH